MLDGAEQHVADNARVDLVGDFAACFGLLDHFDQDRRVAAIELLDRAAQGVRSLVRPGLPLVGQVAAGQPILAEENIEDYVQTPSYAGGIDGEYVLRVRGESMKDAGILEDDLVVVRPQETAQDGDIVVALVGEEATVKRFFQEEDHVRLQPEEREVPEDGEAPGP